MRRALVSVPRAFREKDEMQREGLTTGAGGYEGGRAKGEGEGSTEREERLTRRDQRRDSCLRRVSLRGQEGPREKKEEERNILAGRDICGGGIHAFARNKGTRSKKIKAADGPFFFFFFFNSPLFSLSFASLLTSLPCQDIDVP